jgi:SAM-dependent methyltransferase
MLLGSSAIGLAVGCALGSAAYGARRRWSASSDKLRLSERTARRYSGGAIFDLEFVRGKLRYDPLYFGLLTSGVLCDRRTILDLGCGRGIALALIAEAGRLAEEGDWPAEWGPPVGRPVLLGFERDERLVAVAQRALDGAARVVRSDLTDPNLPAADLVLLLDVLHYLPGDLQVAVLEAAAAALDPGGALVLREPAAEGGVRFLLTRWAERVCALARRDWSQRFSYRSLAEWEALLRDCGLEAQSSPMSSGTPYSNFLTVATKPASRPAAKGRVAHGG